MRSDILLKTNGLFNLRSRYNRQKPTKTIGPPTYNPHEQKRAFTHGLTPTNGRVSCPVARPMLTRQLPSLSLRESHFCTAKPTKMIASILLLYPLASTFDILWY